MKIEELLDMMDDMLDRSWSLPFPGGKSAVDIDKLREIIDDIRLNLPAQLKNAKAIVANQEEIIYNAQKEADAIIKKAEDRARALISKEDVVKEAQNQANDMVSSAATKAKSIRSATQDFSDQMLRHTEETLIKSLGEIKATRQLLKSTYNQQVMGNIKPSENTEE